MTTEVKEKQRRGLSAYEQETIISFNKAEGTPQVEAQTGSKSSHSNHWIADDLVFATTGRGFAISPGGSTICLGDEVRISEILRAGIIPVELPVIVQETLQKIIDLRIQLAQEKARKEFDEHGRRFTGNTVRRRTPKSQRPHSKRTRLMRPARHQHQDIRLLTERRRVTDNLLESHKSDL